MDVEEAKELFTKHGDAFYKGLLLRTVVDSLGFAGMFAAVATDELVDWQTGGGVGRLFGNERLLHEARQRFQQWFLALVKNPQSRQQMYEGKLISEVGPSGSQGQIECDKLDFQLHDLDAPDCPQKEAARIYEHIDGCRNCTLKFGMYKILFPEGLDERSRRYVEQIGRLLWSHFSLMGAEVGCGTVRQFLPLLADKERQILIDTPVTAHVGYCQDCKNDLELLRGLGLSSEQADRLADLYGQRPLEGSDDCERFSEAIGLIAKTQFDKVSKKTLDHIRQCKRCLDTLRSERAGVVFAAGRGDSAQGPCETVERADLFDHCVLFAGIRQNQWWARNRTVFTDHVGRCRTCLQKIFRVHGTIFAAAGRGESGVLTWYDYPTAAKRQGFTYVSSFYVRVGMNLWVRGRSEDAPQAKPKAGVLTEKTNRLAGGRKRRRLIPAAAAAIILMAVGLILLPLRANGRIALGEVYQAIADIQNVCISMFAPGEVEPIHEVWVSLPLQVRLHITQKQAVLFDPRRRIKKTKDLSTDATEITSITQGFLLKVESFTAASFGLVPFTDISDVPGDARWDHVSDDDLETVIPGTEVYDLTWTSTEASSTHYYKWRAYIDVRTSLPIRTHWYESPAMGRGYVLDSVKVVTYPTESEIEALIAETFE